MKKSWHDMFKVLRQGAYVGLPTVVLLLAMTAFFWWHLINSGERLRQDTLQQAELRGRQVNSALTEAVSMLFFNVDAAMGSLIDFYSLNKGSATFDHQVQVLLDRFPAGSVLQVAVIGADGFLEYSNLDLKDKVYLGDREHFAVHLTNPAPQLFVSKPVKGRVSKKWSIQFSRPIFKNEVLQGVMVLSVSPEYLYGTLVKLSQETSDVVLIMRDSGEIMARNQDFEKTIGVKPPKGPSFLNAAPGAAGTFRTISELDNVDRIYSWVRLRNYPVTVVLGMGLANLTHPVDQAIADERFKGLLSTVAMWGVSLLAVYMTLRMQSSVRKRMESDHAANHDALTGLSNRKALHRQFRNSLLETADQPKPSAVLFIDLDGFKPINDQYGHAAGDALLKSVAQRIKSSARDADMVARLGGDEFVVILRHVHNENDVKLVVARIQELLESPVVIDALQLSVGASIGVAMYPEQGQTIDELLNAADKAMYRVKNERKAVMA